VANNIAGVRWYEVRDPSSPTVFQWGTYAPDATTSTPTNRWMASAALDGAGNLALGYSASSASVYPSIRYTSRRPGDSPGTLSQTETTIAAGGGSELAYGRWGDYSSMSVDPSDDCTFWYTQEYYAASSNAGWQTRIASFKLPGCGTAATSTSLTSSPNPSGPGDTVTLTATVSGSGTPGPTGSVTFADGATTLGSAPLSGSTATYPVSTLAAGTHSLTAVYDGDTANASSTSPVHTQTVNAAPKTASATTLSSSGSPSVAGSPVTFTATVTGSGSITPTGTVSFVEGSTTLWSGTLSSGTATFPTA